MQPDVLAYVEYSLKSRNGDDVLRVAQERSSNLAGREQFLPEHQKRVQALGFPGHPSGNEQSSESSTCLGD